MTHPDNNSIAPVASRRAVLMGAGALGVVGVLAACGTDAATTPPPGNGAAGDAATGAIKASEIPVGGGKIFDATKVVVTQPTEGTFKAFSAICTHQGCPVGSVDNGVIVCPCHQSEFKIADGSVARGPATKPLPALTVTANGDTLTIA